MPFANSASALALIYQIDVGYIGQILATFNLPNIHPLLKIAKNTPFIRSPVCPFGGFPMALKPL